MIIGIDASKAAIKQRTGVENFVYQVLLNLGQIDKKNTYYLYTNAKLPDELLASPNFHEKLIPFPKLWNKFRLPLALLKDKPDRYFQPVYMIPAFAPKKSVGVFHDLAWKYFPEAYSSAELFLQTQALDNLKERAQKILCVSDSTKKDLIAVRPEVENRIEVITLAGDDTFVQENSYQDSLKIGPKYFMSLGRLEDRKNTLRIIEAFILAKKRENLPHKLLLIGKPGHGYQKIEELIKENPEFAKEIIIPGYLDKSKINNLLSNCEAFVFPSLYEGFGIPIVEAMKAGAPIITADSSSLPEVAGSAGIIVNPLDSLEIADAMIKVAKDGQLRQDMIKKSLQQAEKYNWKDTAGKILKILEEL